MVDVLSRDAGQRWPLQRAHAWQRWAVALVLFGSHAAAAQSTDATQRQEIATLKQAVERLDARLSAVEQQLVAGAATPPAAAIPPAAAAPPGEAKAPASEGTATPSAEARLEDRWHRVDRGMSLAEIETLLGKPQRTLNQETRTVWLYSYAGIGNGSIVFDADRNVIDWQNPPFRQWW